MSQKIPSDSAQKGFAVGRGLLAAAETLNYSMSEQRSDSLHGTSSRQLNSLGSGMGGGGEGQDRDSQLSRRGGSHISNTMKLFASLGLSPTDLDALAQIPEDNISVETLPHLIMQLKNRKVESDRRMAGNPRDLSSLSPETSYRANREDWEDMRVGRLGGSMGQTSARAQQGDFGYSSMQDAPVRGYEFDYGHNNGSGGRDRQYSELSRDPYSGHGMGPSASDSIFMQRRMGSPSQGKVQDFLGVMPHMFPHVCSLCDFDVHSTMEWTQHINGLRHAENRRLLLQMYPDWDPHVASNRSSGSLLLETTNRSAGLLGPVPMATGQQTGGMSSSWGSGAGSNLSNKSQPHSALPNKIRSRVVVAKYERKPLSNKSLFALAQPFGTLCEHLVLKNKAFLEMETHKEALDMVHYYQQKPAVLYGKEITFYLSKELLVIEKDDRSERTNREVKGNGSQVVFFSNMPRETERKMELLTIARRFGTVDKHLFLNDEAFVQLGTPEDAEMLVKYYTVNPLTIRGRSIRLNICTKYKTLNVNRQRGGQGQGRPDDRVRKQSSSTGTKASSKSTKSTSASTKSKEDKKEESKPAEDDVAVVEESGEEVAGVMEGDDDAGDYGIDKDSHDADALEDTTEEAANEESADAPLESKEEESAPESGDVSEEKAPSTDADVTEHPDGEGAKKGAVSEEQAETEAENAPAETEATPEETEAKDDAVPAESSDLTEDLAEGQEGSMEQDFPENMDDFVTLDELAEDEDFDRQDSQSKHSDSGSGSSKKSGGLRVVNVVGFKRGYGFVNEILSLAKPFGKVVQNLVLDVRPEAFLQLSSEEEAKAMVNFYSGNVQATVCGKAVKIYHSQTYATIQSGRVVYVGQIPHCKYSDAGLLKISEPFGKVRRYFLNRSRNECFIEMERGEEAERMAETYKDNPPKFQGKRLTVYVSRKYKQLKYGHRPPPPEAEEKRPSKRERVEGEGNSNSSGTPAKTAAKQDEEPPVKKAKEEKATESETDEKAQEKEPIEMPKEQSVVVIKEVIQQTTDQPPESSDVKKMDTDVEVKHEEMETTISTRVKIEEDVQTAISQSQAETKPSSSPTPLGTYEPNKPVGVEYVKMGYYCRVCFLFYSNEEAAKKVHCSSQSHYEKLKKHLEKEKAKAQSNTGKKSL